MKRAVAVALALSVWPACGRLGFESVAGNGGDDGDSGVTEPDAFAGCDAGCTTGTASVLVRDQTGTGVPNTIVVVGFPDGSISSVVTTDSTGAVQIEIVSSSMVTLPEFLGPGAASVSSSAFLLTVTGVQPGDELIFGSAYSESGTSKEIDVTMPGNFGAATSYAVTSGCGQSIGNAGDLGLTLFHDEGCAGGEVLASARDDTGVAIAWSSKSLGKPTPAQITLPGWQTNLTAGTVNLTNVSATEVDLFVAPVGGGIEYDFFQSFGTLPDVQLSYAMPTGFGDRWSIYVNLSTEPIAPENEFALSILGRVTEQIPKLVTIDGADLPGPSTNVAVDLASPDRPVVSWTAPAGSATMDMGATGYVWSDEGNFGQWIVLFGPGTGSSMRYPRLPDSLSDLRPASDTFFEALVFYLEMDFIDGYEEIRAAPNLEYLFGELPFVGPQTGPYELRGTVSGVISEPPDGS